MKKILTIAVTFLLVSMLSGCVVLKVKDDNEGSYVIAENVTYTEEYTPPPTHLPLVQYCAPVARIYRGRIYWIKECEWRQAPAYVPNYDYGYDFNVFIGSGSKKHDKHKGHKEEKGGQHNNKSKRGGRRN